MRSKKIRGNATLIGSGNTVTGACSGIAGGEANQVAPGAEWTVIGGGFNNTVSSSGNAILGGVNNNDTALPGVMIAGNNINAASGPLAQNTLHTNGLWVNMMPYWTLPLPVGLVPNQVFKWDGITPLPASARPLYIL